MLRRFNIYLSLLVTPVLVFADCDFGDKLNDNGTVTSQVQELMWSQCLAGQSGPQCKNGEANKYNWVNALNKARGSELSGFDNWRMPKIKELESMLANCAGQGKAWAGLEEGFVWSSSANLDFATEAWAFNLATGKREVVRRHEAVYVLLVRDVE